MSLTNRLLSGIEINQNRADTSVALGTTPIYQEFYLPTNIERGSLASEIRIPQLTGFSFLASVADDTEDALVVHWALERFLSGTGWVEVTNGTTVGAQADGSKVWIDCYFNNLIDVDPEMIENLLRIKIVSVVGGGWLDRPVSYQSGVVDGTDEAFNAKLVKGTPHLHSVNGVNYVYDWDADSGVVYESWQQTPTGVWYANVPGAQYTAAYRNPNGSSPISGTLTWRLLTASGDSGRDFLGNPYRYSIFQHGVNSVDTTDGEKQDAYWFSKPNPSRFAIENLYFDISDGLGSPSVIDSILLDPITPGMYFSVYYSDEGDPVESDVEWDAKLWNRVPKTFHAVGRETYVLPDPIRAKYIKIEFSHLQPRAYRPGPFQQPILYKKHPKWVLDYFLARLNYQQTAEDQFVARAVNVSYNALDLAYNYYLDDLKQEPNDTALFNPQSLDSLQEFLRLRSDTSDQIDSYTLDRIRLVFNEYRNGLEDQIRFDDSLLNRFVGSALGVLGGEQVPPGFIHTTDVSTLNRDPVVFEQSHPVMFFYLSARHLYREVQASLSHDRAYFAGIREVAFLRERYSTATDTNLYVEIGGDNVNLLQNDFAHDNTALVISDA